LKSSGNPKKNLILHVLTLNSSDGTYGGPVRVAKEIVHELEVLGFESKLIAGIQDNVTISLETDHKFVNYPVRQLLRKFPFSSLFSFSIARGLFQQISQAKIVHIHLARDFIPFFAAIVCFIFRVPFVTQTHGMLDNEKTRAKKLIDKLFTNHILRSARTNFVLSEIEMVNMRTLFPNARHRIIPNGIKINGVPASNHNTGKYKILFCSRLHPRKRPLFFIELAKSINAQSENYSFTIFGPDGGSLNEVELALKKINSPLISYMGHLDSNQVLQVMTEYDLLILPSEKEPFPMAVIEALSVGVPVLVMEDCGLAPRLKKLPYKSTCREASVPEFSAVLHQLTEIDFLRDNRKILIDVAANEFNITKICETLVQVYLED
jgi:glycosyltransferase involved in cell wall biosynthesis